MSIYSECVNTAVDRFGSMEEPTKEITFFAYKNGEVREFFTRTDAYSFSNFVEESYKNKEDIEQFKIKKESYNKFIKDLFELKLRQEYNDLPDLIYEECYNFVRCELDMKSYYDIEENIDSICEFARKILNHVKC